MSASSTYSSASEITQDDLLDPTRSEDTPATSPRIFGRYEVIGLLGAGGMGHVYKVRDTALDEVVALKALNAERVAVVGLMARFRAEVKLARRVLHPNVVRTFDLGEHEGEAFLTMEYVPGRSLRRVLAEDGPLAADRALSLFRQAAQGIRAAHQAGVLHCDIKPDNLLVTAEGRLVIADFGVARALGGQRGLPVGTPAYAAPEQLIGAPLEPRADIYGLGAAFYELLSGRRARQGDVDLGQLSNTLHATADPGPLARVPDALAVVVLRCLAPALEDRFPDVDALLSALDRVSVTSALRGDRLEPRAVPFSGAHALAVLPLRAEGLGAEQAMALTEELIDALTATRGLRVRPLSSVLSVGPEDPQAAGRLLGVGVVVTGRVQQEGGELRLRIRVITVSDGFQIWATRVNRPLAESLAAMDQVARGIGEALTVDVPERSSGALPPAVLDLYLRGRTAMRTGWDRGTQRAVALFEEALREVPDDLRLLSSAAMAVARDTFYDAGGPEVRAQMLGRAATLAEQALAQDAESGEAWTAMAHVRLYRGDYPGAAAALQRAVRLSPGTARAQQMLGNMMLEADLIAEALPHLRAALNLDPTSHLSRMDLARGHALLGELEMALPLLEPMAADTVEARLLLGTLKERLGVWSPELVPESPLLPEPQNPQGRALYEVISAWRAARRGEAPAGDMRDRILNQAARLHPLVRVVRTQYMAELVAALGQHDLAIFAVERSIEAGLHDLAWMDRSPPLAALRARPDWTALRQVVWRRSRAVRGALNYE